MLNKTFYNEQIHKKKKLILCSSASAKIMRNQPCIVSNYWRNNRISLVKTHLAR